jgi:hypothetical protein
MPNRFEPQMDPDGHGSGRDADPGFVYFVLFVVMPGLAQARGTTKHTKDTNASPHVATGGEYNSDQGTGNREGRE